MTWPPDSWWEPETINALDGTPLAVRARAGTARPVLLVHGLASNALLWRDVAEELASRGHAVAALDLRGHGRSDRPQSGYNTDQSARDVIEVATALGWADQGPVIAGQSWGGNVALHSAALDQLWGGVLCVDGGWIHLATRFQTFDECWSVLAPPGFGNSGPDEALAMITGFVGGWPPHALAAVLGNLEVVDGRVRNRLDREHHKAIVHSLWSDDPAEDYPRIKVPVHLLVAGKSQSDDVEVARSQIADATVSWHPDAHHDIHVQQPEVVSEQLFSLITRVEGST